MAKQITVALDWTPNTNHTGFYVALAKGWYRDAGLDVQIVPPSMDYTKEETPARKVINGLADFCIAPSESVISSWTSDTDKVKLKAVAAVLQNDTSAIASIEGGPIKTPKDLDGKRYASYEGRFEMNIIRKAIKNDGGQGTVTEVVPPKLDCLDAVYRGEADATWVFVGWEGILASSSGKNLNFMKLEEYGVPYGYSPLLLAHPSMCTGEKAGNTSKFLAATGKGFQFATQNPREAAQILFETASHPALSQVGLETVEKSQNFLSNAHSYLTPEGNWGRMDPLRWTGFVDWLLTEELLLSRDNTVIPPSAVSAEDLYTNDLLDAILLTG